jgi:hypothetical protein
VCLRHEEEACILKTKLPIIAYAENKWLIMFLRTFGRRRPPTGPLVLRLLRASLAGTRQRGYQRGPLVLPLPRAGIEEPGKEEAFVECHGDTRQSPSLSLGVVTTTFLYRELGGTWQSRCRVPDKRTQQRSRYRCTVRWDFFVECHTRQTVCRVFLRLKHSAKQLCSVVMVTITKTLN